ncbi:MAG TPA: SDR family NAD(P)-dependent oxidoreductase [Solirubrobacteraceae bacterium]|jgi:short-subunit dehydrogenase|nr:SDR family NAD(P)-dependent oxidoreductase [Solirubrobacteraceae bacterium]
MSTPATRPDRIAVITGASSGIGEAVARALARDGYGHLVLVARREDRLAALAATLDCPVSLVAVDLTADDAPARVRDHLLDVGGGRLDLLVNNAGAAWRARFADGGYANVSRTMTLNFDAPVRLTEELLPLLRASAPSSIVNVASTASRVARAGTGAYAASKAALAAWTDALHIEEAGHGVHVGLVLPGFIRTEGFPSTELIASLTTRWIVSTPEKAAQAVLDAGPGGAAERFVPRPYGLASALRVVAPRLVRRALRSSRADVFMTKTAADDE